MLGSLRRQTGSWITKAFLLLLVLSFAVWGVSDMVIGGHGNAVASVGRSQISQEEFRFRYQQELQTVSQQVGQPLSFEEGRTFGVDRALLSRMIGERTLDEAARRQGFVLSDEAIAELILNDPVFRDAGGGFSRARFNQFLFQAGLSEDGYMELQREQSGRVQLTAGFIEGLNLPTTLTDAANRFQNEERTANFFVLDDTHVNVPGTPDPAALAAYFEDNSRRFRAPEYRRVALIELDPQAVREAMEITEDDIVAHYEREKERFRSDERRRVFQIVFDSQEEAEAARAAIQTDQSLADVAETRGLAAGDYDLGTVTRDDIFDPAVAEATFLLGTGEISQPIEGQFGTVLVQVESIEPAGVATLEDVRDRVRSELMEDLSGDTILTLYDSVEDDRASGMTFREIAQARGLPFREIAALDREGRDMAGEEIADLPARSDLIAQVFDADVGIEFDPIQVGAEGAVWFDVMEIIPDRDRTLDEVRDEVVSAWREDERRGQLEEQAQNAVERLNNGETLQTVAESFGTVTGESEPLTRQANDGAFSSSAIRSVFSGPIGTNGFGTHANGRDVIVYEIAGSEVPEATEEDATTNLVAERLRAGITDDLLAQYISAKQEEIGVRINENAILQALGLVDGHLRR
ncbi:MAG: SurA N-terminal domain-containing protein [Hyphomicrobiales bacterium]|nr:SurA N-terminal domain-containing protein [Hyphomicrobiales bacterium]